MKYAYEELSPEQFEEIVISICHELLGPATQGFSKGPDGGKDAKFVGTAQCYPSEREPWRGQIIIQAKHTNGYNKTFSDKDFFSSDSTSHIIAQEIPRIKQLKDKDQLDYYMLFSNRRLSGVIAPKICNHIASQVGIPESSIQLFGIEDIERYIKRYPRIAEMAKIDPIDSPLLVSPNDLADIIEALADSKHVASNLSDRFPVDRTSYEQKNKLNNMSEKYAKTSRDKYLKETTELKDFLAAPENAHYVTLYESVIDEFQFKIIAKKKEIQTFDAIMEYLVGLLFDRDPILSANKRLTRIVLFYMYWNCDIGESNDA